MNGMQNELSTLYHLLWKTTILLNSDKRSSDLWDGMLQMTKIGHFTIYKIMQYTSWECTI